MFPTQATDSGPVSPAAANLESLQTFSCLLCEGGRDLTHRTRATLFARRLKACSQLRCKGLESCSHRSVANLLSSLSCNCSSDHAVSKVMTECANDVLISLVQAELRCDRATNKFALALVAH